MQTPTIMLDPMIGKILTAKQAVEPSSTTIDTHRDLHSTETPDEAKDSSTPAEVRLVVKFIVEEHTVYKGIVRKIKQLESEELSRVVSHIAWDGANEIDKVSSEGETDETSSRKDTPEISYNTPQTSSDRINGSNDNQQKDLSKLPPSSNYANDDLFCGQDDVNEGTLKEFQVQERSESNNDRSDHEAYVKCCTTSEKSEENIVAQNVTKQETAELNVFVDCDMTREQSSNLCETDNRQLSLLQEEHKPSIPNMIEEKPISEELVHNVLTDEHHRTENTNFNRFLDSIHDGSNDSQSVTEALNECVMNVDLESKQRDEISSSGFRGKITDEVVSPKVELSQQSTSNIRLDLNGKEDHQRKNSVVDTKTEEMLDLANDKSSSIVIEIVQECAREESVKSNLALATDTINTNSNQPNIPPRSTFAHPVKEGASCSIVKRKVSSLDQNHSTGKRIRRASSHKEQRSNLNTRKSASKTLENASAKQNLPLDVTGASASPTTMIQPPQVFAKWSDNHFYPGYIIKQVKDRKFVISFLDGAQKDVAETDLIPLRNIVGKQVRVTIAKNYCYNAIVHEQAPPLNDQPQFDVEYQSNNGSTRRCVSWKDIFLTGEQGSPLINQVDRISGASNFADVDLDNIIYEKRSRRIQDMEEFYFTGSSPHRTKTSLLL